MATENVRVYLPKTAPITEADIVAFARGDRVQICDVVIEGDSAPVPIRLHMPYSGEGPTSVESLPSAASSIAVLVHDEDDHLSAVTRPANDTYAKQIAAAVAVMRAAWAWDERAELEIRVNSVFLVASPQFDANRRWNVKVRLAAV